LLNVSLIANEHKLPVNDTLWNYFSNNAKTKIKLYNELSKIKQIDKFDKKNLSQIDFCKTILESNIVADNYNTEDESVIQKTKPDSVYFFKTEKANNKYENGLMYFFNRVDAKTKVISLAAVFVNSTDDKQITTNTTVIESKRVIEVGKTTEETIQAILSEFHYKYRKRYVTEKSYSNYDYSGE